MKISVIIPVYNGEKYIKDCLERLKREDYDDMEVIAVNDGSTDNTASLLDDAAANWSALRVIHKENGGVSTARNTALDCASGEGIIFLDCDDYMEQGAVSRLAREMEKSGADVVRFRLCYAYPNGSVRDGKPEFDERVCIDRGDFFKAVYLPIMSGIRYNHIVRTLYKRSVIDGLRFRTDMKTAEDLCFNIEVFKRAKRFVYLPDLRYFYYCSGTGLTGSALSWSEKAQCNKKAAQAIKGALGEWGCDSAVNRLRIDFRILRIAAAKIKRIIKKDSDAF